MIVEYASRSPPITFDVDGNLYFAHHYWDDATSSIIEADIYMCPRK